MAGEVFGRITSRAFLVFLGGVGLWVGKQGCRGCGGVLLPASPGVLGCWGGVFERRSGGFIRNPSAGFCVRSLGKMPSITSLSLNFRRTQRPSVRGRVVKVLRSIRSVSENSRTK